MRAPNACKSMLGGLLHCPLCKRCMRLHTQTKRHRLKSGERKGYPTRYYHCIHNQPADHPAGLVCNPTRYRAEVMEGKVLSLVRQMAKSAHLRETALRQQQQESLEGCNESALQRLQKQIQYIERKIETVLQAQIKGIEAGVPTHIYEKTLRDLSLQKTQVQTRLEDIREKLKRAGRAALQQQALALAGVLENVNEALMVSDLTDAQKRSLLGTVIENIYPEGREEVVLSWRVPVGA